MKKVLALAVIMFVMVFCLNVFASESEITKESVGDIDESQMIYGEKHVFTVKTPENWAMDDASIESSGVSYVIRPNNEDDWNNVYIYANGSDRPDGNTENFSKFVSNDIKDYKGKYRGIKIKKLNLHFENLKNSQMLSGQYIVNEFSNFSDTYKEIVVYIEFPEGVGTLVFSTKNEEAYDKYYDDFINFVKSFTFIANKMYKVDLNQE